MQNVMFEMGHSETNGYSGELTASPSKADILLHQLGHQLDAYISSQIRNRRDPK